MSICKQQRILVVLCCALFALLAPGAASSASHPLVTGVEQPDTDTPDLLKAYDRIRGTGAGVVRIMVYWASVEKTKGAFNWTEPKKQINYALSKGLDPLVTAWRAPGWAENGSRGDPGTRKPDAGEFGKFAHAIAAQFPAVHRWEAWNEPNEPHFLRPQKPSYYRKLLNAFSDGIHAVDANDIVAGGGLSPRFKIAPLAFMRSLFCLDSSNRKAASCPVHVDAWSHHPYTNGGPFKKQGTRDGVSLGDLPRMHRTLRAAVRAGNVHTNNGPVQFWVSEFSWDSDRPDPYAVPMRLLSRWVSEALHQSYKAGVSVFVWHQLRDRPITGSPYQSGFYFCGNPGLADDSKSDPSYCGDGVTLDRDAPKTSSIRAFRFPFVAYAKKGRVRVWGRTADAAAHTVTIERKVSGSWRKVKSVQAGGHGIFSAKWRSRDTRHVYAAFASGSQSVPFSLKRPKRFRFEKSLWGCGGAIPC